MAVFLPTRAEVERLGAELGEQWKRLTTAFYHGGEPIRVIRPFLEGEVERPFLLAMTAAGQSALNVRGLDTVVIYDARYGNVVERGRNVLHRLYLGRQRDPADGRPGARPGAERRGRHPERPRPRLRAAPAHAARVPARRRRRARGDHLRGARRGRAGPRPARAARPRRPTAARSRCSPSRGLVEDGRLTAYGREVEAMPVERPWGELLVHADAELVPMVAVCSNIDSLHRMTREERDLHGVVVNGSDHLTAYNLYAEAVNQHGYRGRGVRPAAAPVRGRSRRVGRATRRAGQGDRGHGARHGVGVPRRSSCRCRSSCPTRRRRSGSAGRTCSRGSCRSTS